MALDTRIVRSFEDAARYREAWRDVLARSASDQPTKSPLWLNAWWRVFGSLGGRKLRLTLLFDQEHLVGVAPLLERVVWYAPGIPLRRLELLGTGEPEEDEICSDHVGLVAERGRERWVAEALVAALVEGRLGAWDELVLKAMDDDDALLPPLERALADAGISVKRTTTGACPYVALPRSFDEYLASLGSDHRYLVRRSLRDFEHYAAGDAVLDVARTRGELEQGQRILEALHAERWRASGRSGVFASPRFRAFHDEVMAALLDEGALDLSWLSVRGKPIAAAYSVIWNEKVHFYQSGRALDVPKGIRPGIVLHAGAIRRAIEAGRTEYDFLAGTSQYKRELATNVRPIVSVRAVRAPLRERARTIAERCITRVKALRPERQS